MSDANTRESEFLIIRRSGSAEAELHKGGVWKIAYADFMTAMMAFFLVMWLINATSETTKTGVANYFNPIKLSDGMQLPKKGLSDPEEVEVLETEAEAEERAEAEGSSEHSQTAEQAAPAEHETQKKARFTEDALFRDPYAVLAAIAAQAEGHSSLDPRDDPSREGAQGTARESYGDPFDPSAWDGAGLANAGRAEQSSPAAAAEAEGAPLPSAPTDLPENKYAAAAAAAAGRSDGHLGEAGQAAADVEAVRLQHDLLQSIKQSAESGSMPNITVEHADGGVLISLADQVNFGMFAIGSAEPLPETIAIMAKIAGLLKDMPGQVIIRGHTDGRPFRSENYDNWRLSAARAHMAYHMLVRGGLDERRVERIEGYADRDLKLPEDPDAAENRRIDILVQHEEARS